MNIFEGISDEEIFDLAEQNRFLVLSSLSFSAAELANCMSFAAFHTLCRHYAGSCLHIPKGDVSGTTLAYLVGVEAARRVQERFGGGQIKTPGAGCLRDVMRPLLVEKWRKEGLSGRQIASWLGCSATSVQRYRRLMRELRRRQPQEKPQDAPGALAARGVAAEVPAPLEHPLKNPSTPHLREA